MAFLDNILHSQNNKSMCLWRVAMASCQGEMDLSKSTNLQKHSPELTQVDTNGKKKQGIATSTWINARQVTDSRLALIWHQAEKQNCCLEQIFKDFVRCRAFSAAPYTEKAKNRKRRNVNTNEHYALGMCVRLLLSQMHTQTSTDLSTQPSVAQRSCP